MIKSNISIFFCSVFFHFFHPSLFLLGVTITLACFLFLIKSDIRQNGVCTISLSSIQVFVDGQLGALNPTHFVWNILV